MPRSRQSVLPPRWTWRTARSDPPGSASWILPPVRPIAANPKNRPRASSLQVIYSPPYIVNLGKPRRPVPIGLPVNQPENQAYFINPGHPIACNLRKNNGVAADRIGEIVGIRGGILPNNILEWLTMPIPFATIISGYFPFFVSWKMQTQTMFCWTLFQAESFKKGGTGIDTLRWWKEKNTGR